MKAILVPIDFSKCSLDALKFAAFTAKRSGAKIHLISIIEKQNYYFLGSDPIVIPPELIYSNNAHDEKLKNEIRSRLDKITRSAYLKDIPVEYKIGTGLKVFKCIEEYSRISKSDMIIMGSSGAHGITKILIGSNAERVSRFSKIPVLIMNHSIRNIKTIIFASDFEKEAYRVFPFVQEFAKVYDSEIHLLKVNIFTHYNNAGDIALLKKFNKKFNSNYKEVVFESSTIASGIHKYADKINSSMIAIGTHGKKGLIRLLFENVSEETIRYSAKPVLTVNLKK
ncbi:MAG TPA: universal stress protein [Ignavibacteria bacterium]|nr:universal stress protein [Ignavibacteria bacterium]HMR40330.1 universal stress protein [Ignavibacteria bacterium]